MRRLDLPPLEDSLKMFWAERCTSELDGTGSDGGAGGGWSSVGPRLDGGRTVEPMSKLPCADNAVDG